MVSGNSDVDQGPKFTIEDNVLKGMVKPINLKSYNIGHVILDLFNDNPKHVAQIEVETDKITTFADMKENTIRCALWLEKQGIGNGDVVVICTHNQSDAYIPCIASFFAGAIYNPWHHEVALRTARHQMNLTRPKVIFSCESAVSVLKEAARLENVDVRIIVFGKHSGEESLEDIMRLQTTEEVCTYKSKDIENPDNIGMILFSSGTTGMAKGVAHSFKSLYKNIISFTILPVNKCISLWYSSLYWISGTYCMLQSILTGATRILHANFDPDETCKVIEKYKVNWFFIPPTMATVLCKSNALQKYELESLKSIMTGGAKIGREIIEYFRNNLHHTTFGQGYGMTELGGVAAMQSNHCKSIDSVGFVMPNVEIKIIDVDTGKALGPNEHGELCVRNSTLMVCYYKNPTATKEAIDEEGWLHSGDKAYYDESGEIFIIDRIKEVMKFRGHHVSPFEIEEVLVSHPAVMEAAVVPVPHDLDLERPMAFVRKVPGVEVTEDELVDLSSVLGESKKLWGGVKFLNDLPYTASGKISRKDLKEMAKMYSR